MPDDYPKNLTICVDRMLPPDKLGEAADAAIRENPANLPVFDFRPPLGVPQPRTRLELAVLVGKKWKNGRTLRVRFLDGVPEVQAKIAPYARLWGDYANIKFDFGNDPNAEIRISFKDRGNSWSVLGTDALTAPQNEATMNYGWLEPGTPEAEYSRVVIHEFGHALGCIHEHQNPATSIPWDKPAVYRYYAGLGWNKDMVDWNLFFKYDATTTQYSQFDNKSIMLYPIPNELTIGDFEVGWNRELSFMDKQFIGTQYPLEARPTNRLEIGAPAIGASIGVHGEVDKYDLVIPSARIYNIETEGPTDVVMALFGPNSPTNLVAQDDDSGQAFNARISTRIEPGNYNLEIRHYRPRGTGNYKISARAG